MVMSFDVKSIKLSGVMYFRSLATISWFSNSVSEPIDKL